MSFLLLSARLVTAASLLYLVKGDPIPRSSVIFNGPFSVQQGGIQNINVVYEHALHGELTVAYGSCDSATLDDIHHRVGYTHIGDRKYFQLAEFPSYT